MGEQKLMNTYRIMGPGNDFVVKAESLGAAAEKMHRLCNPTKANRGLFSVTLVAKGDTPVVHDGASIAPF